jgi:prepilin-type N-terminal cleavage/methylation domain-containing protein
MQKKHDEGFSLIEILVAIVILAAFVVPICSALLMTNEMNNRTDALMQAQLNVSSAVEMLMAEGIKVDINGTVVGLDKKWSEYEEDVAGQQIIRSTEPNYITLVDQYPNLQISINSEQFSKEVYWIVTPSEDGTYYSVTVISKDGLVEVSTSIRKVS